MRFVRYASGDGPAWGVQRAEQIHPFSALDVPAPDLRELASAGYRRTVVRAIETGDVPTRSLADLRLLAPVPTPGKIVCVGLNYHDHAEEQGEEVPERPMLFSKAPSSVTGPGRPIVHPDGVEQVDYEVELAFVVGRTARDVSAGTAEEYVAGYTVLNDVSARDAQFEDGQFFRGKSYDTFAPMGPALVTGEDLDPNDLDLELRVDGEVKQSSSTSEFIFTVEELLEYISGAMTLRPGDVVTTGTPGGVGIFADPPDLLEPGDRVEAEVEELGVLANHVVADAG